MTNNILAIVVLYKESLFQTNTYKSLLEKNDLKIFIYDNSPEAMHIESELGERFVYFHDRENRGLSVAYNTAAQYARNNNFRWLLLLDQDTLFPLGAIEEYIKMIKEHPSVMLFAPVLQLQNKSWFSPILESKPRKNGLFLESGIYDISEYRLVNSGLLVNTDAFGQVGGYNEKIRLDFSDFEFIKRFRKHYKKFGIIGCVALQDFSSEEKDINKLLTRFKFFCESAKMCSCESLYEKWIMLYTVSRRMFGLIIRNKNIEFLYIFYKNYVK